ncbi:MAG TPA: SRPBCC domain-containing protein [Chloroflexota bacterium]|nr:SRPBCC domain-containing protein [Chloroflexota bacterium]
MRFEDSLVIHAPAKEVWDFLLDVNRFATCMPGVDQIAQIDERTFDGLITASVGPMSGKFQFRAHIVDSKPPTELAANVEGTDSVTKSKLTADVQMTLTAKSEAETELHQRANVEIKGRLAILGDMVVRATASLLLDEFGKRLRQQLETPPSEQGT